MGVVKPTDAEGADDYAQRLEKVTIGTPARLTGAIVLAAHDPTWSETYRHHALQIRGVLDERVLRIEHVGSTAVPGLPAKPIIDIVLEVPDSADEPSYAPDLSSAGYRVRIREPDWFQHRLFSPPPGDVNLHVFCGGCPETGRMIQFRDRLRSDRDDRELYARTKQELAARSWSYMQQYADAKTEVIASIMSRAQTASVQ